MRFDRPLREGRLIRRYQRFLADVELDDGGDVTAHTPNTGSMLGCCTPGSRVWLRDSGNPARKYRYGWELVEAAPQVLVGVNTSMANQLVQEAIDLGVIAELQGYPAIRREQRYGSENSRVDLLLERGAERCYVEVKNVTLAEAGTALFPDAVSARASKHLRELTAVAQQGQRAAILFCVQRGDVERLRPADRIDPVYGRSLREAVAAGVLALAYRARIDPAEIRLETALPVELR